MQHWVVKQDELKQMAAHRAVEAIESGMIVGLGTGSTTSFAVIRIAERIKSGDLKNIVGIPTSVRTEKLARQLDIHLATLDEQPEIDVTIDGADARDFDDAVWVRSDNLAGGKVAVDRLVKSGAEGRKGAYGFDDFKQVRPKYEDPCPLSDTYLLCSRMTGKDEQMGIYLLDVFGNEVLVPRPEMIAARIAERRPTFWRIARSWPASSPTNPARTAAGP